MYFRFHAWRLIHLELGFLFDVDYGNVVVLYEIHLRIWGRHILALSATVRRENIQRHVVHFKWKS